MYTITTFTTDGQKYEYEVDSLDAVDQFLSRIQYRDNSQLLAVSSDPITLTYAANVKAVVISGVSQADIAEYEAKRQEQFQTEYARAVAEKTAHQGLVGSGLVANACHSESVLTRLVR